MAKKEETKSVNLRYKLRLVVDIEGETNIPGPLENEYGIEAYCQWATEDIEENLDAVCSIVGVKKIELEEIE